MKTTLTGYVVPTVENLKQLDVAVDNPLLIHNLRAWYVRDTALSTSRLDIVDTPVGKFQAIPTDVNNDLSYGYQSITINTSMTSLSFSTLPRCLELNLSINTYLQFTGLPKFSKYLIKINFNGYVINNIADLIALPAGISYTYFLTNYNYVILEVEYITKIFATVLFAEGKSPAVSDYSPHTNSIVFDTKLWSSSTDSSSNSYVGIASGAVSYKEGISLNTHRLAYTVDNAFNMNEVDFTIEAFIRFVSSSDYGTIFGRWSSSSRQFWMRIDTSKTLLVSFNEGVRTVNLSYDLTNHLGQTLDYLHIVVTRTFNVYKLFINGVIVDSKKSTPFMATSNAKVTIGKLENSLNTGVVGNTSFPGVIREIKVTKAIKNNYLFNYVYPSNAYGADTVFVLQNGLTEKVTNVSPSFTSTVNLEPVLGTGNRRSFSLGNYSNTILNKRHHLEYPANSLYSIDGDVTIEAWVKNITGNTRGTIVYHGDATNCNFTLGLFDGYARFDINNSNVTLTGTIAVPYAVWTHVAFVRQGTSNRLYVNGLFAGSSTSSEPLNAFGTSVPMCIKRVPSQNGIEASLNTSLYPSKSQIEVEAVRIVKQALYNGTDTVNPNFLLPGEFRY